jgi:formate--tetrahydrofolate ligase
MSKNLEIAQRAVLEPISEVAKAAGLGDDDFEPLGRYKAKLTHGALKRLGSAPPGKVVLVTAITPTPAGEGKTTTTIGLTQGLVKNGLKAISATREPALGPVFGIKGGAAGGGYSQVLPMEDINLFFTGDFPAIAASHNLLSAMLDAHVHNGNALRVDTREAWWPRTMDMNDRALREIVVSLGGKANGFPRTDGFVIVPASEVMAILCLATSVADLRERLGRVVAAVDGAGKPVTAADLKAQGAMTALMRDAARPNLVQTMEGGLAFVHGGPFANIAHGCSSVLATRAALGMADFVVTEGGFASDLGAEKYLHIATPAIGVDPSAIVLVATVRALKHHGDGDLGTGIANLERHMAHLGQYGVPVVVSINKFGDDSDADLALIAERVTAKGGEVAVADPFGSGGEGCRALATKVAEAAARPSKFTRLYPVDAPIPDKLHTIATKVYGGDGVILEPKALKRLGWLKERGLDTLPVCVAKTQSSLSDDPKAKNAPTGFKIRVRDLKPSVGAGFVVAIAGEIMLMPGLGATPAAANIDVDEDGRITGIY